MESGPGVLVARIVALALAASALLTEVAPQRAPTDRSA